MSIFGPADTLDAAITTYVDQQDALRVLKSGDAMSGNLAMGGNLVSGLPEAYPPAYSGDEAISWAQVVALVLDSTTNLTDPQNPQDIATKAYVDNRTDRVFVVALVGAGEQDHQQINLGSGGNHLLISPAFKYAYGASADSWNLTTGRFTAPAGGAYAISVCLRILSPAGTGTLSNLYTSINGSVNYSTSTNIVYRVYGRINNLSEWHTFEMSGLVTLNQGDTLRLVSSYGIGTWTFHTSASIQIARVSI